MSSPALDRGPSGELEDGVAERIRACGVVPVVELPRPDLAASLAMTLLQAGLPAIELTFRAAGAPQAIAEVRDRFPSMLVGAGTVLDREDAARALDAGAHFIVSPGTNPAVVEFVLVRGGTMLPGVATPSEIEANLARGIRDLKFFPAAASGGPTWLRSVRGPYRHARFVPTGGVTPGNLADYLALPNVLACGGTWLAPVATLERGAFEEIAIAAKAAVAIVQAVRESAGG